MISLGENIRKARKKMEITQEELYKYIISANLKEWHGEEKYKELEKLIKDNL